ncbi:MAG: 23S rRNA (adenine(2503)-C(2))-methyltransferase RlmN, partial [Kurthia sp.]|nr:23S rRNA (adenine(2503)-C(2))-methyltransferase RlmN [Kurthia sp.]
MEQENLKPVTETKRVKKEKPVLRESIYSLLPEQLEDWLKANGEKAFRAKQIYDWLYVKRVGTFEEMSNLSKGLRDKLAANFELSTLT